MNVYWDRTEDDDGRDARPTPVHPRWDEARTHAWRTAMWIYLLLAWSIVGYYLLH